MSIFPFPFASIFPLEVKLNSFLSLSGTSSGVEMGAEASFNNSYVDTLILT